MSNPTGAITTPEYWDCECEDGKMQGQHIHPKSELYCLTCGCVPQTQPDSILTEVLYFGLPVTGIDRTVRISLPLGVAIQLAEYILPNHALIEFKGDMQAQMTDTAAELQTLIAEALLKFSVQTCLTSV